MQQLGVEEHIVDLVFALGYPSADERNNDRAHEEVGDDGGGEKDGYADGLIPIGRRICVFRLGKKETETRFHLLAPGLKILNNPP